MSKPVTAAIIVLGLLAGGGYYGWRLYAGAAAAAPGGWNPGAGIPAAVVEAERMDVPQRLSGIGTIQAVHQVTVAPEVAGRVTQILFEPGAVVKAGTPLIQLNDAPVRADLASFQAQARLAELNLARSKQLIGRQFAPQQQVDQDQAALDEANAGILKSQAQLAQMLIRAPFEGQLGLRQAELGQYLQAGGAVTTLTDLDHLYVNFTLPEQSRSALAPGQAVELTVDAFPGRVFRARLATIEPQISPDTRNMKLQATLENPDHALLPGMFADVSVVLPPLAGRVTVPETAIEYSLYGDSVFALRQDGVDAQGKPVMKAVRSFVKTGPRFGNRVVVVDGLAAGDTVVESGQLKLSPGDVILPVASGTLTPPDRVPTN